MLTGSDETFINMLKNFINMLTCVFQCDEIQNMPSFQIDGLVQERLKSSVLAMELRLSSTNPSRWYYTILCLSPNKKSNIIIPPWYHFGGLYEYYTPKQTEAHVKYIYIYIVTV